MDCNHFVNEKNQIVKRKYRKIKKRRYWSAEFNQQTSRKISKKILIAGGTSFYGLSDLIIVEGTMTDFAYGQTLLHYKNNYEEFKKINKNIIFEQDRASTILVNQIQF